MSVKNYKKLQDKTEQVIQAGPARLPSRASSKSKFRSPWSSAKRSIWNELRQWPFEKIIPIIGSMKGLSVHQPHFAQVTPPFNGSHSSLPKTIHATWLGHSSALVQFKSISTSNATNKEIINVLFNPMFNERASPSAHIGPRRLLAPPCRVEDLPPIHAVCISHNHYDHLDKRTISKLIKQPYGSEIRFYIGLGNRKFFLKAGVNKDRIIEKDWWEEHEMSCSPGRSLRITCVPAQHGSSRTIFGWGESLWCGWVVRHEQIMDDSAKRDSGYLDVRYDRDAMKEETEMDQLQIRSVYFVGDTGYRATEEGPVCPVFREIGDFFGGIDLAFIPIWRGGGLSFLSRLGLRLKPEAWTRVGHCTPSDAVQLHIDIKSRLSIAVHHGTFVGSEEESLWCLSWKVFSA